MGTPGKVWRHKLGIIPRHQGKNAQFTYRRASAFSLGKHGFLVFCFCVAQLAAKWGLRRAGLGARILCDGYQGDTNSSSDR